MDDQTNQTIPIQKAKPSSSTIASDNQAAQLPQTILSVGQRL
jgi:hypothetical protein